MPQVAVCTPGRMIDLLKMKACTCLRATYLVFDEADRMFDMGFEPQVRLPPLTAWPLALALAPTQDVHTCSGTGTDTHHHHEVAIA